jgi:hypothetical protein
VGHGRRVRRIAGSVVSRGVQPLRRLRLTQTRRWYTGCVAPSSAGFFPFLTGKKPWRSLRCAMTSG